MPLAIELAAARLRLLPLAMLVERLTGRLHLLTGGPRDLPVQQATGDQRLGIRGAGSLQGRLIPGSRAHHRLLPVSPRR
jgi:predicted ATPase